MRFRARSLACDHRGGAGVVIAAALPMLIGAGALAVDVGSVQLESRRLQGIADAAAIAAATDPAHAQTSAEASVADAAFPHAVVTATTPGIYRQDPTVAVANRFTAGSTNADAARVTVTTRSPTFLARIFGFGDVEISRKATAQRQRFAAFSIGSRLASVNGGLVNAYLSALTGSNISLSVMDYNALAGADVDLLGYIPMLRTRVAADALTFDEVLATKITAPQALGALADTLAASGQTDVATVLRSLAGSVSGSKSLTLGSLVDLGPMGRQGSGGTGIVRINVLSMVTALLQGATDQRQVSLDLAAGIPGLASTRVSLAVGERVQRSPWIAISDAGTVIVRTAQTRAYVEAQIAPTAIPGLAGLIAVRVPIFVELAAAEGRVSDIACPTATTRSVGIEARTNPGSAALGSVDVSQLGDFSHAMTISSATLVDTLLVDVFGSSSLNLGGAEPWQALRFNQDEIAAGTVKTVRSSTVVSGVAASLLAHPTLTASFIGLPIPLTPLLTSVGGILSVAATPLDQLLGLVTGTLGVGVGEADLRVTGIRCGMAVLVA